MDQKVLEKIAKDYKDNSRLIETMFEELNNETISDVRKQKIEKLYEKYSDDIEYTCDDNIALNVAVSDNLTKESVKNTNKVLMYISELSFETYAKRLGFEVEEEIKTNSDITDEINSNDTFILYMDIENGKKHFIKKDDQEDFEANNNVIIPYKNPNCSKGANFEKNYSYRETIRNEFIKEAIDYGQEEAVKVMIKKYPINKD